MIKITFLNRNTSEIAGLKDGDVIDVSSGEMKIIAPERVKTYSCGCTRVDEKNIFHCKVSCDLYSAILITNYEFHNNPSIENEDALLKAISVFRQHLSSGGRRTQTSTVTTRRGGRA
jgi:hypothetical protein